MRANFTVTDIESNWMRGSTNDPCGHREGRSPSFGLAAAACPNRCSGSLIVRLPFGE